MEHNDEYFHVGTIVKAHGVKGNVVVRLDVDKPTNYRKLSEVYIRSGNNFEKITAEVISLSGDHLILHLEGINDMDTAAALSRTDLYLPLSSLPGLTGKDIYLHEAIGMKVVDINRGEVGIISKIYDLPEQPVCSIPYGDKEILVPLLKVFIDRVDRPNKTLYMNLPEGLVDLYLD